MTRTPMIRVRYQKSPVKPLSQVVRALTYNGTWTLVGFVRQRSPFVWVARCYTVVGIQQFRTRTAAATWLLLNGNFAQRPRQTVGNGDLARRSRRSPAAVTAPAADCVLQLGEAAD